MNTKGLAKAKAAPMRRQVYRDKYDNVVEVETVQQVRGRAFYNDAGTWNDARYSKDIKVIKIKPFSEAQFKLLRAVPELGPYLAQGEQVLIVVGDIAVQTDPDGQEDISDGDVNKVVSNRSLL